MFWFSVCVVYVAGRDIEVSFKKIEDILKTYVRLQILSCQFLDIRIVLFHLPCRRFQSQTNLMTPLHCCNLAVFCTKLSYELTNRVLQQLHSCVCAWRFIKLIPNDAVMIH